MTDTATRESGPVDAPASADSIADQLVAEIETGNGEAPASDVDSIAQELVNEAESDGGDPSQEEPAAEDDATDPADEAGTPDEGNPADQEQLVTVKVNGEDRQIPLSEALAGYSRLEDYKAKTAEVARDREALANEKATLDATIKSHYASQLEQATSLFAQFDPVLAEARTLNWEALKQADPAAYLQAQEAVQTRLNAIQQMQGQAERARAEATQQQEQDAVRERAQRFDQTADKIVEAMPEMADEAKFRAFASDAVAYLRGEGFTSEEITDALDHRVLTMADKARKWDAHQAAQATLPEKKVVQKSAVKPLTTDGSGSRATQSRFPGQASRERKVNWIVNQLQEE